MKVIHIINGLGGGGAEHMLYKLLENRSNFHIEHIVISLTNSNIYGVKMEKIGIKVINLNIRYKNFISSIKTIVDISKDADIIDTWLYKSDFIGYIIAKKIFNKKIIWNIRRSNLEWKYNKLGNILLLKLNAYLSQNVDLITYNSRLGLEEHVKKGYFGLNSKIMNNGFNPEKYKYSQEHHIKIRNELNIDKEEIVLITVGRYNIQKGYDTLLKSLYHLKKNGSKFKMLMIGDKLDSKNLELNAKVNKFGLSNELLLLGRKENVVEYLSCANIYISSSIGEGFSNSIAEALLNGLHCVVTNVGNSKELIDENSYCVEPNDHRKMSEKIKLLIDQEDFNLRNDAGVKKISNLYDIKSVTKSFEENYAAVMRNSRMARG